MHHLTDMLLTLIEENDTWKVAFGFNKGDATGVKSGGHKLVTLYQKVAKDLFSSGESG